MSNIINIAEAYYLAMGAKNVTEMGKYLHPDVHFDGPQSDMKGRGDVLDVVAKLLPFFQSLTIRDKLSTGNQVMVAYDIHSLPPIGNLPVTAILTIEENQIIKIVLFYDARPFDMTMSHKFGQ